MHGCSCMSPLSVEGPFGRALLCILTHSYRCQMSCPRIFSNNKDCHLKILYDYLNSNNQS